MRGGISASYDTTSDDKSTISMESRRHILLDDRPNAYSAHVYNGRTSEADVPGRQHIHVHNDFNVARQ